LETVEDRIACLNLDMPITVNKTVCGFINFFTVRKRNYTQTMLERKNYYFPIFEYYLKKHEMPDALKYLAIVESGLKFNAKSKSGAVGLWQFMPGTGKDFYLAQNQHIDERQHPYLATEAACKFLKYLHGMFNDWELALAAYNCGPGNVLKAMRKSGKRGFWEIYNFLPQETRAYVPQFHAVVYSMNFAAEHNIRPDLDSIWVSTAFDTFQVQKSFDLVKLESILGLPGQTLGIHNPCIKSRVYPANCPHPLLVPKSHSPLLAANLSRFIDSAAVTIVPKPPAEVRLAHRHGHWRYYKAARGERLDSIAARTGVALASLKKWNHLHGYKLNKTSRLKILVPDAGKKDEKERDIQAIVKKDSAKRPDFFKPAPENCQTENHVVKKGEKLYQVAVQYGLSIGKLKALNHLNSSKIYEGQVLKLKKEAGDAEYATSESKEATAAPEAKKETYVVQQGDRLFAISQKFNISLEQLRQINDLESDQLKAGQILKLSTVALASCRDESPDSVLSAQRSEHGKPASAPGQTANTATKKATGKITLPRTYLVQKGDTLYSISRKFTKLSVKELIKVNKLKDKNIKPGQQLIVG
jgi:membrane-bound lytic murein transglycosylase D